MKGRRRQGGGYSRHPKGCCMGKDTKASGWKTYLRNCMWLEVAMTWVQAEEVKIEAAGMIRGQIANGLQ